MPPTKNPEHWAQYRRWILLAWMRGEAVTEMRIPNLQPLRRSKFLSVPTIQNYVREIYAELDVRNAPEAVAIAISLGYVPCCEDDCHRKQGDADILWKRRAEDASDVLRHEQRWGRQ